MSADFQHDVFLSHNQADKPRVRRLAERLRPEEEERAHDRQRNSSRKGRVDTPYA